MGGMGKRTAKELVKTAGTTPETRVKGLTDEEGGRLRQIIDRMATAKELLIEGDLRREVAQNIKRMTEIGSYRGSRHRRGLPLRGPRTRTNPPSPPGAPRAGARKKKAKAGK